MDYGVDRNVEMTADDDYIGKKTEDDNDCDGHDNDDCDDKDDNGQDDDGHGVAFCCLAPSITGSTQLALPLHCDR